MNYKKAFTLMEILVTIGIMAVLALAVFVAVSNYVPWAADTRNKRMVSLLNDSLSRFKQLATAEKFAVLNGSPSYPAATYLGGPNSTAMSRHVIDTLNTGFVNPEIDNGQMENKFVNVDWGKIDMNKLRSTGTGMDFWFAEYTGNQTNATMANRLTVTAYRNHPYTFYIPADRSSPLLFSSTNIPAALNSTVNPVLGVLSGTPTTINTYDLTVQLSETATGKNFQKNITVHVREGVPIITSLQTASAVSGTNFSTYTITALNDPTSFSATGLPPGLTVASNGQITGTPLVGGSGQGPWVFPAIMSATNSAGTGSESLTFTVQIGLPVINNEATCEAHVNEPFAFQLTATNNPLSFSATGHPSWVSLNTATGLLTGVAPASENDVTYNGIVVTATNTTGTSVDFPLTLKVQYSPDIFPAVVPQG